MATAMITLMVALLLLGFPMLIPLLGATMLGFFVFFAGMKPEIIIQQIIGGVKPSALIAVPMFILAADIITRGHSADRLLDLVMRFVGHLKGGLAVTTAAACTLFGAVSGSTQATVVAIGGPLRPKMLEAGYKDALRDRARDQRQRHRLPDPALDRHDHLRRGLGHLDRRAVHRRDRARAC